MSDPSPPNDTSDCFSAARLGVFLAAEQAGGDEALAAHLAGCPACLERLTALALGDSSEALPRPVPAAERLPSPDLAAVQRRILSRILSERINAAADADASRNVEHGILALQRLGRFDIQRLLGHGGYGVVFLAHDPALRRQVALKISRVLAVDRERQKRFLREAQATARLHHKGIVPIFDAGEVDGFCYLTTAYCPGQNLAQWLAAQAEPVSPEVAVRIVLALAEAAGHAHDNGVLHRDIKPTNVMLDERPTVGELPFWPMLTDFGMAKLLQEDSQTESGSLLGTPGYIAPEQVGGRREQVGPASDVYSLGVILYELLTGVLPFQGSLMAILVQIATTNPRAPSALRVGLNPRLDTICLKMLAKRPEDRYASMSELSGELREFLQVPQSTTEGQAMPAAERIVRRTVVNPWWIATAVVVATIVVLAWVAPLFWSRLPPADEMSAGSDFVVPSATELFTAANTASTGGINSNQLAIGDLNADGRLDLVVTHGVSNEISVLLGTGGFEFLPPTVFPAGGSDDHIGANHPVIADFDRDGKLDIAYVHFASSTVGVWLGNGRGGFSKATTFSSGGINSHSLVTGDFNGDRLPDLAVGHQGSDATHNLSIFLNSGNATFSRPKIFGTGGLWPDSMVVKDFNADGKLDLAAANFAGQNIGILLGDGGGGFALDGQYASGGPATNWIASGDFNRDSKPDLVVVNNNGPNEVGVLLNNGQGTFAAVRHFRGGGSHVNPSGTKVDAYSVAVADVDADGQPDIVVANIGSRNIGILRGNGQGDFSLSATMFSSGGLNTYDVQVADFNQDGRPDLAVVNADPSNSIHLLRNNSPAMSR